MAENVVDQLIVELELRTAAYERDQKKVDSLVSTSEKKLRDADDKKARRDKDAIKRNKEMQAGMKSLAGGVRSLALTVSSLLGVGVGAAGLVGLVANFVGLERGLNTAAVGTGRTNREMMALRGTAQRLNVDIEAGANALAELSRQQQQMKVGGDAHSLAAFATIGVAPREGELPTDMLERARQRYQSVSKPQQNTMETQLAQQGVDPSLIAMLKSDVSISDAYAKSLAQAAQENTKALTAANEALASLAAAAASAGSALLVTAKPAIEKLAEWLGKGATWLSNFNDDVQKAGGGLEGFEAALRKEAPAVAEKLGVVETALRTMGEAVDVAANGLKLFGEAAKSLAEKALDFLAPRGTVARENYDKIVDFFSKSSGPAGGANAEVGTALWAWIKKQWPGVREDAERNGPAPIGHLMGWTGGAQLTPPRAAAPQGGDAGTKMEQVIASILRQNPGLGLDKAIAIAENWRSENDTFDPARRDSVTGTHIGIGQWDTGRQANFKKMFGHDLAAGTVDEQIRFALTDPYEKSLLAKSFAGRSGVRDYAVGISQTYEAHGNAAEDLRRGERAAKYADQRGASGSSTAQGDAGTTINMNGVTVVASNPQELVTGVQRVAGPQYRFTVAK